MRSTALLASCICLSVAGSSALAQADSTRAAPPPLDGVNRPVRDTLLDRLAGSWRVSRRMGNATTETKLDAEWVLKHQFLRLHYHGGADSSAYEAMVFIGYDNTSDRYVAHWIDIFGGRFSETLGYGKRVPRGIQFVFEYPDGPFTNTFTSEAPGEWSTLLRQKNARGEWTVFAEERLRRP